MLDQAGIIKDNTFNYGYLKEWCSSYGAALAREPAGGFCRISFPGPAGENPVFFWLPRLGGLEADSPLGVTWGQDTFYGPDAYLPGMLAVLLNAVAGAGRGVDIILSTGGQLPVGLDPLGMYYFLLPTDFQLCLAHKGEYEILVTVPGAGGWQFGRRGEYEGESLFIGALEEALAPKHPIYPVGPDALEAVRPFFLLGHRQAVLMSLVRGREGITLAYRLNSLPGDGHDEVTGHFKDALSKAGCPDAGLAVRRLHPGGRSRADQRDLDPVLQAFSRVTGLQPDVDWFMWPSPAGVLCHMGYKTAAFGPGRYLEYRAGAAFDRVAGERLGLILQVLLSAQV